MDLEPSRYGTELFQALFPEGDDLLVGYRESLAVARHENRRLRLRLHIASTAPQELHDLHWELLYDVGQKLALGRSQETAFSRYLGVSFEPGKQVNGQPRLLVVLSSPRDLADYDLTDVDYETQLRELNRSLSPLKGRMNWEVLRGPATVERIRERLVAGEFHALHLLAHGLLPQNERVARLVLEAEDHRADFVDEELFAEVFAGQRDLRLISLMACHSGMSSGRDPFTGLGPALIQRGVPAVLAMRRQVSVEGANRFTRHFYSNLARSGRVDSAVNEARMQLYLSNSASYEWGTPALFMRLSEGRLWNETDDATENTLGVTSPDRADTLGTSRAEQDDPSRISTPIVRTLVAGELADRSRLAEELGDERMAEILRRHDRLARDLLQEHGGLEADRGDGFLMLFDRPLQAVRWTLAVHQAMAELSKELESELAFQVGIHLGEVVLIETPPEDVARGARPRAVEGLAKPTAVHLMSLAQGGQTLLSSAAFDLARRSSVGAMTDPKLRWLAHGDYYLAKTTTVMAVFEVGIDGEAPLAPPAERENARRAAGERVILGWRPAIGLEVPQRPHWILEKKLSEGGFGEVWLAHREKIRRQRVFKFCFEFERLKALQREITLFRLLKEELGDREDIARILDWNFKQAPYFIESEYAADGNLLEWAEDQGGIAGVQMELRLEIIAQVAMALSAAHSVGVLHKDVKPANVLIATTPDGIQQVRLADFGIGAVTERERLDAAGITVLGMTAKTEEESSHYSGTRLYMAPELLEGKRATLQTDVYALGVMLYQAVVGDFSRALAPGWRRDIDDDLLCEDIALAVDGSPKRRLGNVLRIAERLRSLKKRRQERELERRQRQQVLQAQEALKRLRKRRTLAIVIIAVLIFFAGVMTFQARRIVREAETARQVSDFLLDLFRVSDPSQSLGNSITAREILDRGAQKIEQELRGQPEVQARLMHTIGVVYRNLGLYNDALPLLENALATRREIHGGPHLEVAESLGTMADLRLQLGQYEEAEKLCREALEMRGPVSELDVAEYMEILGTVLAMKSDQASAEPYFREALAIRRSLLGHQHPAVASSLYSLARLLHAKGAYEESKLIYNEALGMQRLLLGDEHPAVASTLNALARLLKAKGDYDEAEQMYRAALAMRRNMLGEQHTDVADTMSSLAALLRARGRYGEAEQLYREALTVRRQLVSDQHPDVAGDLLNLAKMLQTKGDYESAEPLYREALAMRRHLLGNDHADVASTMNNLASLLLVKGDPAAAEPLLRDATRILRQRFGDRHPWLASALGHLALSFQAKGDHDAAEQTFRESLVMRQETLGEEHPLVAQSFNRLANLLYVRGHLGDAEQLFRKSLALRRQVLGEQHPHMAYSLSDLARLLINQGQLAEAESLVREALEILHAKLPTNHWRVANANVVLGSCLTEMGHFEEAESLLLSALSNLSEKRNLDPRHLRNLLQHTVTLYEAWGQSVKATEYRRKLEILS